jgi:hypothetical protein
VAVSQGRAAMGVEGNQWYRPVLYLRWRDNEGGQLFVTLSTIKSINKSVNKPIPSNHPPIIDDRINLSLRAIPNQNINSPEILVVDTLATLSELKAELYKLYNKCKEPKILEEIEKIEHSEFNQKKLLQSELYSR